MTLKTHWLGRSVGKFIVFITRVSNETFRKWKRYEDKSQCLPLPKYGVTFLFFKGGTNFFRQIYGEMFYMGTNYRIMQGRRKSFTKAFSSTLNTVNLKFFPGHGGRHT